MWIRLIGAMALGVMLAGCGGEFEIDYEETVGDVARGWTLGRVDVTVPTELTVSDRNRLAPDADIVWHGDPAGDRREQVRAILKAGIGQGAAALPGRRPVVIAATLEQFHAVTPRAVSTAPAAVHNIDYVVQVFDARTGEALTDPQRVQADLEANVGAAAVVASEEGRTQKVRITSHLARVTAGWLGLGPDLRETFVSIGR